MKNPQLRRPARKRLQRKFVILGKLLLLTGVLIAVGLLSAFLAMRIAVRGTEVEVPKLQGKTIDQVKKILAGSKLKLEVSGERYDAQIPKGVVVSQHPDPGVPIKEGREVQVILSLGKRQSPVPDLKGTTLRAAQLMAVQSGYEIGNISKVSLAEASHGQVVRQFPVPNSKEIVSPKIDLLISSGETHTFIMPDMIGQDLNRVVAFFQKNGFKVGKIDYRTYANVPKGTVVKQFPEPGYMLASRDSINLEVAR